MELLENYAEMNANGCTPVCPGWCPYNPDDNCWDDGD